MPTFSLPGHYSAAYVPYRRSAGFVAKGALFYKGKPVEIFEARGRTLSETEEAAKVRAKKLHRHVRVRISRKAKKRSPEKG